MNDIAMEFTPTEETERLAAVRRYDILDTPPDGAFDRITSLAARHFNVPISIVSIVDHDRIWFKSHYGLPINQIGRDDGLCATTILSTTPRVLTDAKNDSCALVNPLVAGDFGLRFYAGVPLTTYDGHNLGTLCVVDTSPREVTQSEIDMLTDLAGMVMDQLELRISARQAVAREKLLAREIDHRVMNSLQFISSMLAMQSVSAPSEAAKEQLQMAANRVVAVAQVHRNFYSNATSEVSCVAFLQLLCADLSDILGRIINVTGDNDPVPTTLIQPIGLIANEMVTNAAKHGAGRIDVSFRRHEAIRQLRFSNNGAAFAEAFDPKTSKGLGMRVINSLVRQLNGTLEAETLPDGAGAAFTVTFPAAQTQPNGR
jgi:two-component sensor histidine kinase